MQQPPCLLVSQDCSRDTRLSPAPTSSCKRSCSCPGQVRSKESPGDQQRAKGSAVTACAPFLSEYLLACLLPAGSGAEPASGGGRLGDDSRAAWNAVNEPTPTPEQQLTRHGSLWLASCWLIMAKKCPGAFLMRWQHPTRARVVRKGFPCATLVGSHRARVPLGAPTLCCPPLLPPGFLAVSSRHRLRSRAFPATRDNLIPGLLAQAPAPPLAGFFSS